MITLRDNIAWKEVNEWGLLRKVLCYLKRKCDFKRKAWSSHTEDWRGPSPSPGERSCCLQQHQHKKMLSTLTYFSCKGEGSSVTVGSCMQSPAMGVEVLLSKQQKQQLKDGSPPLRASGKEGLAGTAPIQQQGRDADQDRVQHHREQCPLAVPCSQGSQRVNSTQSLPLGINTGLQLALNWNITLAPTSPWSAASTQVAQKLLCLLQHSSREHM